MSGNEVASAAADGGLTIGERIAWHRRRKGISQEVLADQVGRTVDWLSKIENNRIECDRLSVITSLAEALRIPLTDLVCPEAAGTAPSRDARRTVIGLREALLRSSAQASGGEPVDLDELKAEVERLWQAFQDASFGLVTARAPFAVRQGQEAVAGYEGQERQRAQRLLALAYQVTALTLTKVGDTELSLLASDRGLALAEQAGSPSVLASLYRSMTHSLLAIGDYTSAVRMTAEGSDRLRSDVSRPSEMLLSSYGSMFLAGAMAASRAQDRSTTRRMLDEAQHCASRLGRDQNHLLNWFGPTNVAIHRVATAMELGDVQVGLDHGPRVDVSGVSVERRVRHSLEVARAFSLSNRSDDAMRLVLEAECIAPEQVRSHFLSRRLVTDLMRRQRGKPAHHLAGLAQRVGVN